MIFTVVPEETNNILKYRDIKVLYILQANLFVRFVFAEMKMEDALLFFLKWCQMYRKQQQKEM